MAQGSNIDPSVLKPAFGITGLPAGTKEAAQRADFRTEIFDVGIEAKGYRLAWSRASQCPCIPTNPQTQQADPNCFLCGGKGWFWFGPPSAQDPTLIGTLNWVQKAILAKDGAAMIRGLMVGVQNQKTPFEKIGNWAAGTATLTVRAANRLGYYDRVVNLDSTIVYDEVIQTPPGLSASRTSNIYTPMPTRYLIEEINLARSLNKIYDYQVDYDVLKGVFNWLPGKTPPVGTPVAIHYHCHPAWLITDHPHSMRVTNVAAKVANPVTPEGNPIPMPIQATVRLEFLPE